MLTFYKGGYNDYMIRVEQFPTASTYLGFYTENMTTQQNYGILLNPGQWTRDVYESYVSFSINLDIPLNPPVGTQYRAWLIPWQSGSGLPDSGEPVWHGSMSVFASQSIDKPEYTNQIPLSGSISHDSTNDYIILQ